MGDFHCGCLPEMSFSGAISFASYIDGSVWTAGPLTYAVVWLRSALLGWCSLRPPCSFEWHVVDGCARRGGTHTKSMCKSSVLVGARRLDRQLVITLFVAAQGQQNTTASACVVLQWLTRSLSALAFRKCRVLTEMDCLHRIDWQVCYTIRC